MINFATLQALDIPEGKVVEIKDASGRVIWAAQNSKPIVLQVEKQTKTTYAGETSYADEVFIMLDIYPKTNGTVKVTYGGLTKTITDTSGAESPNAQSVYFGTYNGVSDSVATPSSGELIIEGNYVGFASGAYKSGSKETSISYLGCITKVVDWGSVTSILDRAFSNCSKLTSITLPSGVTSIGNNAFSYCTALTNITIPSGVTSIGNNAFVGCSALGSVTIPNSVTSIGEYAFDSCTTLTNIVIPNSVTSLGRNIFDECSALKNVTLSSAITSIPDQAFYNCEALANITIPNGVTSIGRQAFYRCKGFTSLTIPSAVTFISYGAFGYCSNITSVVFAIPSGWWVSASEEATSGTAVDLSDTANNKTLLTNTYTSYYWRRS